jgi:hypothetical protein
MGGIAWARWMSGTPTMGAIDGRHTMGGSTVATSNSGYSQMGGPRAMNMDGRHIIGTMDGRHSVVSGTYPNIGSSPFPTYILQSGSNTMGLPVKRVSSSLAPVHSPHTFYHPHRKPWQCLIADDRTGNDDIDGSSLGPVHTPRTFYHRSGNDDIDSTTRIQIHANG